MASGGGSGSTRVLRYDGQSIWTAAAGAEEQRPAYELGSFLGGGASGVVYEAECVATRKVRGAGVRARGCVCGGAVGTGRGLLTRASRA